MKWFALILIVLGIAALIAAHRSDVVSSFDDGSFLGQIALLIGGVGAIVIGGVLLLALVFVGL